MSYAPQNLLHDPTCVLIPVKLSGDLQDQIFGLALPPQKHAESVSCATKSLLSMEGHSRVKGLAGKPGLQG